MLVVAAVARALPPSPVAASAEPGCAALPAGAVLAGARVKVAIRFTEAVDGALTRLAVVTSDGRRIDRGGAMVDRDDRERKRVAVSPWTALGSATYTVRWCAVKPDDDTASDGRFCISRGCARHARPRLPPGQPGASPRRRRPRSPRRAAGLPSGRAPAAARGPAIRSSLGGRSGRRAEGPA